MQAVAINNRAQDIAIIPNKQKQALLDRLPDVLIQHIFSFIMHNTHLPGSSSAYWNNRSLFTLSKYFTKFEAAILREHEEAVSDILLNARLNTANIQEHYQQIFLKNSFDSLRIVGLSSKIDFKQMKEIVKLFPSLKKIALQGCKFPVGAFIELHKECLLERITMQDCIFSGSNKMHRSKSHVKKNKLKNLKALNMVNIASSHIPDSVVLELSTIRSILIFILNVPDYSGEISMTTLCKNLSNVRVLQLSEPSNATRKNTIAGIKLLAAHRKLVSISFTKWNTIYDDALEILAIHNPQLMRVDFQNCPQLTNTGIASLKPLQNLKQLAIGSTHITELSLEIIANNHPKLELLVILSNVCTEQSVTHLNRLQKLVTLDVVGHNNQTLTLNQLQLLINNIQFIETFSMWNHKINNNILKIISNLKMLKILKLQCCYFQEMRFDLSALNDIACLDLSNMQFINYDIGSDDRIKKLCIEITKIDDEKFILLIKSQKEIACYDKNNLRNKLRGDFLTYYRFYFIIQSLSQFSKQNPKCQIVLNSTLIERAYRYREQIEGCIQQYEKMYVIS